jgi:hypothetical protein
MQPWVNYDLNTSIRNNGSREDKPTAMNEMIFCYTEKALREEFEGAQYESSEKPVELCNLDTNALQSIPRIVLTAEKKESQERELKKDIEDLFFWLDNLEKE